MTSTPPTRAELETALANADHNDPLARRIAAHLASYTLCLQDAVKRAGGWPDSLTLPAPATEVEAFALELFTRELAGQGIAIAIKGDS